LEKIKSGILGLNPLMDGGINEKSTTVVIGASGAGKTTMATQFIKRGLELGQLGIYVSLDENKDQIIQEAEEMGWQEIHDYLAEDKLVFIDASGKEFSTFIKKELPSFVTEWEGSNCRVVIDPLTPVIWATQSKYEQRELLAFLLKETKRIGTVLATLEEHGTAGDLSGPETAIPMYLADAVIHLRFTYPGMSMERSLKIVKCRNSRHSKLAHPYRIIGGFGIVIQPHNWPDRESRRVTRQLKKEIRQSSLFSEVQIQKIEKIVDRLRDEDLGGLEVSAIITNLLEEYGE